MRLILGLMKDEVPALEASLMLTTLNFSLSFLTEYCRSNNDPEDDVSIGSHAWKVTTVVKFHQARYQKFKIHVKASNVDIIFILEPQGRWDGATTISRMWTSPGSQLGAIETVWHSNMRTVLEQKPFRANVIRTSVYSARSHLGNLRLGNYHSTNVQRGLQLHS